MVEDMIAAGVLDAPPLIQLCTGIKYGAPADRRHAHGDGGATARLQTIFSAFAIGRMQIPFAAMAVLAGGNVRVGLEDNLMLSPRAKCWPRTPSWWNAHVTLLSTR